MVQQKVIISNPTGLHLRPAGKVSNLAATFASTIRLQKGSKTADAKSLLALLGACVKAGDELTLICDGADEAEALRALVDLIQNGL